MNNHVLCLFFSSLLLDGVIPASQPRSQEQAQLRHDLHVITA